MANFSIGEQVLQEQLFIKEKVIPDESEDVVELKKKLIREAFDIFEAQFGKTKPNELKAAIAPGRVNLIGEHVDYCDGFVLPMAIPLYTVVLGKQAKEAGRSSVYVYSSNFKEKVEIKRPFDGKQDLPSWTSYVRGSLFFSECPVALDFVIHSTIPAGSGLSSSAALELSVFYFARQFCLEEMPSPLECALLCQKAEHTFSGVPCGVMDQFVIALALPGHALRIDCRSLDSEHIPIAIRDDAVFLVTNSGVKHSLASGEYRKRRQNVDSAVRLLGVPSWRDVNEKMISEKSSSFHNVEMLDNAYHVVNEIERTVNASNALLDNNIILFGKLMTESHVSLRDKYKVSCSELDELVDLALSFNGVFGSRMTGGGFGGCTVTLVKRDQVEALQSHIKDHYSGGTPSFFVCDPAGGVSCPSLDFLS